MTGFWRVTRDRYSAVVNLADLRECDTCGAIVESAHGERAHRKWHKRLEQVLPPAPEEGHEYGDYVEEK